MRGRTAAIIGSVAVLLYVVVFWRVLELLQRAPMNTALVAVCGALAGAVGGIIGSFVSGAIALWNRDIESREQMRTRVSGHALDLARMDYDLRQRALTESRAPAQFLAPAKVYREFYRALISLHERNEWPKEIEHLGLLNIFTFDPSRKEQIERDKMRLTALRDFLGAPRTAFLTLQNVGKTYDQDGRRALVSTLRQWEVANKALYPENIQRSITGLANMAGTCVDDFGLEIMQTPQGFDQATKLWVDIQAYIEELEKQIGEVR